MLFLSWCVYPTVVTLSIALSGPAILDLITDTDICCISALRAILKICNFRFYWSLLFSLSSILKKEKSKNGWFMTNSIMNCIKNTKTSNCSKVKSYCLDLLLKQLKITNLQSKHFHVKNLLHHVKLFTMISQSDQCYYIVVCLMFFNELWELCQPLSYVLGWNFSRGWKVDCALRFLFI